MTHGSENDPERRTGAPAGGLGRLLANPPWHRRAWSLLFPWGRRRDRAVHAALEALGGEMERERRLRAEAVSELGGRIGRQDALLRGLHNAVRACEASAAGMGAALSERLGELERLAGRNSLDHQALDRALAGLAGDCALLGSRVAAMDKGIPFLEGREAAESFERFYLAFEDRYRGSREEITGRLQVYLPHVEGCAALAPLPRDKVRVVDLGCGRGEWIELLRGRGFAAALGVDSSLKMIDLCRGRGLPVEHCDSMDYLRRQPDHSIGVVSAMHMIEHMPFPVLFQLLEQCRRVLVPGGLLILETPNCNNVLTATQNFPTDPTHRLPVPPILLSFAAGHAGFRDPTILPLHPYGPEYHVDASTPIGRRFNEFFFGPQDYALLAHNV